MVLLSIRQKATFSQKNKASSQNEEASYQYLIFIRQDISCRNWHRFAYANGCRSFIGPVPQPTLDELYLVAVVNTIMCALLCQVFCRKYIYKILKFKITLTYSKYFNKLKNERNKEGN
jgi:hypothetical protein